MSNSDTQSSPPELVVTPPRPVPPPLPVSTPARPITVRRRPREESGLGIPDRVLFPPQKEEERVPLSQAPKSNVDITEQERAQFREVIRTQRALEAAAAAVKAPTTPLASNNSAEAAQQRFLICLKLIPGMVRHRRTAMKQNFEASKFEKLLQENPQGLQLMHEHCEVYNALETAQTHLEYLLMEQTVWWNKFLRDAGVPEQMLAKADIDCWTDGYMPIEGDFKISAKMCDDFVQAVAQYNAGFRDHGTSAWQALSRMMRILRKRVEEEADEEEAENSDDEDVEEDE